MKPVGKPDAGKLHVRFDERGGETERAKAPPRLSSTLLKRGKTDAADAEAISEAVIRKTMRNKGGIYHRPEPLSIDAVAR